MILAAAAFVAVTGAAQANNHEYKPRGGVNLGGASGQTPQGIHPECAAKTNCADMVDCIKEKAREKGKADVMRGKGKM